MIGCPSADRSNPAYADDGVTKLQEDHDHFVEVYPDGSTKERDTVHPRTVG